MTNDPYRLLDIGHWTLIIPVEPFRSPALLPIVARSQKDNVRHGAASLLLGLKATRSSTGGIENVAFSQRHIPGRARRFAPLLEGSRDHRSRIQGDRVRVAHARDHVAPVLAAGPDVAARGSGYRYRDVFPHHAHGHRDPASGRLAARRDHGR